MSNDIKIEELQFPMPWGHVAAKAWGSSSSRPVLVVHGLMDNAGSFDRLIPLLPQGYYFVCIDLPGHGFSSYFPEGILVDHFQYVTVIRRVLNHLKWPKYWYLGHSFGALVGVMHCVLHPEEVVKLISLDSDGPVPLANDDVIGLIRYIQDHTIKVTKTERPVRLYTFTEVIQSLTNSTFRILSIPAAQALVKRGITKVGDKYKFNHDPRLHTGVLPILNNEQHAAILKELKTPILVIRSTQLELVAESPQSAKIDPKNQKNCFVTVEGEHDVHNNSPERVAPHIWKFFGNLNSVL